MSAWYLKGLFSVTEEEERRITAIISAIDTLAISPTNQWQRTVNTNEDHLRMWLITGKLDDDTPARDLINPLPRLDMTNEKLFEMWVAECKARKQVTEIERCACTILMRTVGMIGTDSQSQDERIVRWAYRLCTHANWFWWGPRGVHSNDSSWKLKLFDYAEYYKGSPSVEQLVRYSRYADDAILGLGGGIASYRHEKRPDGDQVTRLDSMSDITVTSSLAAAVAEFHARMMSAQYTRYNED